MRKTIQTIIIVLIAIAIYHLLFINLGLWSVIKEHLIKSNLSIIEIIYYSSAPILVLIGIYGLRQITVAKRTSFINSKRESYKLALEQIDFFNEQIVKLHAKLVKKLRNEEVDFFKDVYVKFDNTEIKELVWPDEKHEKIINILIENDDEITTILNRLDCFSTFFTSGVASETLAFSNDGKAFCEIVKQYLPILYIVCIDDEKLERGTVELESITGFEHLFSLFYLWHPRLVAEKIKFESENLIVKYNNIKNKEKKIDIIQ